jgi:hypothetical protein
MAKRWSMFEEELLAENYNTMTIKELMELLPGKSQDSINAKIKRLKRKEKIEGSKDKDAVNRSYRQRRKE